MSREIRPSQEINVSRNCLDGLRRLVHHSRVHHVLYYYTMMALTNLSMRINGIK